MKFALMILAGLFSVTLAWARPEIVFPAEAEVSNTAVISVFQVADIRDLSGIAFNQIAQMPLVEKADLQDQFLLSGQEISEKVRSLVRNSEDLRKLNPIFKIPSEVKIKVRKDGFSQKDLETSFRNILVSRCSNCTFDIHFSALPKIRGTDWSVDWTQEVKSGSFMLPVRTSDVANSWITGTVRTQKQVPVAKRLIRYGERVQADDLEVVMADITYLKEDSPEVSQLVGLEANHSLSPRAPVVLSDMKREPAARRGQIVKIVADGTDFEVTATGSAEENGFIGDLIKVKSMENQKMISATVIDKGVVKIQ